MMREIKFRGKVVDGGHWVCGYLVICDNGDYVIVTSQERAGYMTFRRQVIPETVGQYTGLKDSNGVEIYEGDILSIQYCGNVAVEFKHGCFGGKGEYDIHAPFLESIWGCGGIVIGNIHDNPELLEVE